MPSVGFTKHTQSVSIVIIHPVRYLFMTLGLVISAKLSGNLIRTDWVPYHTTTTSAHYSLIMFMRVRTRTRLAMSKPELVVILIRTSYQEIDWLMKSLEICMDIDFNGTSCRWDNLYWYFITPPPLLTHPPLTTLDPHLAGGFRFRTHLVALEAPQMCLRQIAHATHFAIVLFLFFPLQLFCSLLKLLLLVFSFRCCCSDNSWERDSIDELWLRLLKRVRTHCMNDTANCNYCLSFYLSIYLSLADTITLLFLVFI